MFNKPLICIVGPTASGKTALSIALAKLYSGEIVSADSMQIYKGMDIGTAKPNAEERAGIPHHMMDFVDIQEPYSVARYVCEATEVIEGIYKRGNIPIVAGGTGLYIDSLLKGLDFASGPADDEQRKKLEQLCDKEGCAALLDRLRAIDPEQAEKLHVNDRKRIIRALEVYYASGEKLSEHNSKTRNYSQKYNACVIGITFKDRQLLYDRINLRVDKMIEEGVLDELRQLIDCGVERSATAFQAIGYKELLPFIEGEAELAEAVEMLKQATRRYAKRQLTWFRRNSDINWLFADEMKNFSELLQASTDFIRSSGIIEGEN